MRRVAVEVGRLLAKRMRLTAPWDRVPRSIDGFPLARIRTTHCQRDTVHQVVTLTPYATQAIIDDLRRSGPGTSVDVTLPADAPEPLIARTERELTRLRSRGVEVVIRHGDASDAMDTLPPAPSPARALAELAVLMGRLLHELQSERALTVAHLAARGETPSAHLEAQWRATDGVLGMWRALLVAHVDGLRPLVRMHADAVTSLLSQLEPTRRAVQAGAREVSEFGDYYTQLTHALLATVDGLVAAADAVPTMTAHLAFLHAKEEAAVEQLEVASGAARRHASHGLAARVASRAAYLRTFATTAAEPLLSEYRARIGEPGCGMPDLDQECPHDTADAEAWYRTMATVFERFHDVESRSAATLLGHAM